MSTSILILKCQCGLWNDTRYDNECDCGRLIKECADICDGYDAVDSMVLDINKAVIAIEGATEKNLTISKNKGTTEICEYADMDCDCYICMDNRMNEILSK